MAENHINVVKKINIGDTVLITDKPNYILYGNTGITFPPSKIKTLGTIGEIYQITYQLSKILYVVKTGHALFSFVPEDLTVINKSISTEIVSIINI